jgi:hypothetical protein
VGKPEGKRTLGKPKRRWDIILKRIFEKQFEKAWTGSIWLKTGTGGRLL